MSENTIVFFIKIFNHLQVTTKTRTLSRPAWPIPPAPSSPWPPRRGRGWGICPSLCPPRRWATGPWAALSSAWSTAWRAADGRLARPEDAEMEIMTSWLINTPALYSLREASSVPPSHPRSHTDNRRDKDRTGWIQLNWNNPAITTLQNNQVDCKLYRTLSVTLLTLDFQV